MLIIYPTITLVEARELSDMAKARDANGDGMLQRDEAGGRVLSNFDAIDCDKNEGLDGTEIRNFIRDKGCQKVAGSLPYGQKINISGDQENTRQHLCCQREMDLFPQSS